MKTLRELKKGDIVERLLAGVVTMNLKVTEVSGNKIMCGSLEFDRRTGMEVDPRGFTEDRTGSYIRIKI